MKIAVAQSRPTIDIENNRQEITHLAEQAAADGARLIVFPEEAMLLAGEFTEPMAAIVEREWLPFETFITDLARLLDLAIVIGGYEPSSSERPHNTLLAIDNDGTIKSRYHKLHLYDAFTYKESDYVTPGGELPPVVELAGVKVGLINCYEVRFPEQARYLIDQGAEILTVSAAWVAGARKEDHWTTLVRARAIENTAWVIAAGTVSDDCVGLSMIVDPMGVERANLGEQPGVAVVDVTPERTEQVRAILPSLKNRRLALTYAVKE
ncbi:carbon-nitrogen hydrolase family protein [Homoserinimonas sp. OAct 916]|uniref:carbon-nitrogen hydrolase family protein n=1 Tax=Homoserinimonas sp. OAct 916 TaxID=2211450 RepID=UPI000DBE933F|nr:carbon-nitrogen hydrolase family protein [Homoserinimonas sp. OAct 916]